MMNITKDKNNTNVQEFSCTTGIHQEIYQKVFIMSLHIIVSLTAFLGNSLILVALRKESSLHPPSKLLFISLACTDLCVGIISEPINFILFLSQEHSKFCLITEMIANAVAGTFCGVSLATLTAISVDRLLALTMRLRYRRVVTIMRVRSFVLSSWIASFMAAVIFVYDIHLAVIISSIGMTFLLAISTFCYWNIYKRLQHRQTKVHVQNITMVYRGKEGKTGRGKRECPKGKGAKEETGEEVSGRGGRVAERGSLNIARYKETVSSALWVHSTLLGCYLPFGIISATLAITGQRTHLHYFAWDVAGLIVFSNSALNPFLYCWKIKEVRQAVKDTIRQLYCCPC